MLERRTIDFRSLSRPLDDDGESDIASYNKELEQRGNPVWHDVAWLYSECYLCMPNNLESTRRSIGADLTLTIDRRIETFFSLSKHWKGYDVFARQKMSTFKSSRPAVLELASRYRELAHEAETGKRADGKSTEEVDQAERLLFSEMCEICLWGNATDLSLLTSLTYEDIQKLQGSEARKASEKNIIVNDLDAAFEVMQKARKEKNDEERRVDIVLDNSGFELFVDLILAGYLLNAGLATTIVLHPKRLPWFVSDVTPKDFSDLLNSMFDPQAFYTAADDSGKTYPPLSDQEVADVKFLFEQWSEFHQDGKLIVRPHSFWTTQGCYWRMPHLAPELFNDLKESQLVLFKGDLNYRKLTNDVRFSARAYPSLIDMDNLHRPNGTPQLPSQQPSAPWVQNQVSASWPSALVKPIRLSVFPLARTRSSVSCLMEAAPMLASGLGVGSGLLCHFRMARLRLDMML